MKTKTSKNTKTESKSSSKSEISKKSNSVSQPNNSTKTTYIPVSKNIYNTGVSYRVRVSIKGETVSINTSSKREAYRVRKQLLEMRGK